MPDQNGEAKLEQKVEHIMITKVQLIISLIVFLVPVISFFFKIQMDVALIKQNHYVHIEQLTAQIEDLQGEDTKLEKDNKELLDLIISYNSKLDQLLGAHGIKP